MSSLERILTCQHHPDKEVLFLASHTHPGVRSPWQPNQGLDCHHAERSKRKSTGSIYLVHGMKSNLSLYFQIYCAVGMESIWPSEYYQRIQRVSGNLTISVSKECCPCWYKIMRVISDWWPELNWRKWRQSGDNYNSLLISLHEKEETDDNN